MFFKLFLLCAILMSNVQCEILDNWDPKSLKKVEILSELITFWMQEADQLEKQVDKYKAYDKVVTKRMKLLEEKLELVEAENSDLTKKYFDAETRLYEAESRCRNNNDKSNCDDSSSKDVKQEMVNANQTIDVLMQLLNSNKGQLLSCHRKVKNFEQESSDIKAKLSRKNKKISKLSGNLQETEHRLKLNLEQLDSAKNDLGFCKTAAMDTEAEKIELEAELKTALDKIDDVSKECRVPGTEGFGWTENNGADSLDSCLKKFEKEIHMEREKIWEKAWQKQDYSMCVRTCDMMRTAACKLAFNFLPFKGYLLECD